MNQNTIINSLVYLMIDIDTHCVFVEQGLAEVKSEINPIGFYIRFVSSMKEAIRLKNRFDKRPYLVESYIKNR